MPSSLPGLQPTTIDRPRLVGILHRWRSLRLIQIIAPAGYGKTTFAASWVRSLMEQPAPERPRCAWLTLDAGIDGEQLTRRIIERLATCDAELHHLQAVRGAGDNVGKIGLLCTLLQENPRPSATAQASSNTPARSAAPEAENTRPILLVIDNAHLLTHAETLALLQQLIDQAPDHLHIVLLARTPLDLHIVDLILRDEFAALDVHAMALDHDEFENFIRVAKFDSFDADTLASLEAQTRGWIAGLKLLAHHYKYSGERFFEGVGAGASAPALRRFLEKLVGTFSPDERRVLHAAALLPWVTPALLGAIFDRPEQECVDMLRSLSRRFTFLTPYENNAGQFACRLHPLLRDFLRERAAPPHESGDELALRAALWLIEHGDVDAALDLLTAERIPDAADALAARMRITLLDYDIAALQRWLRMIPTTLLERHPDLAVLAAWTACFAVSPEFAAALERAAQTIERSLDPAPALRAELLVLRGLQQMTTGATSVLPPLIARIEPLVSNEPSLASGYLSAFRGWAVSEPHNTDAWIHAVQRAADVFDAIGFRYGAIEATVSLGFLKRRTGNAHGAIHALRTAEHILLHSRWELSHIAIMVQCTLGEQLYLTNQTEQARAKLREAVRINGCENLLPEFGYLAVLLTELCDLAEGRPASPSTQDFTAWNATLNNPLPQTIGVVAAMRILRDFRRGAPEACRLTVEQLAIFPHQLTAEHPDSIRLAVLSGTVLGGIADAGLTPLFESTEARCHSENFFSMALHVRLLRILHEQMLGDLDRARSLATPFFTDIERTGLHRLVLDFPALTPLLRQIRTPFTQHLLAQLHANAPDVNTGNEFMLSAQELRIVRMMLSGNTAEIVARRLDLSNETVRSHLRRIFAKMNVHSRAEMLDAARAAGLHLR